MGQPWVMAAAPGSLALGALGALLVVVAVVDLFATVFNYDGFSTLADRVQRLLWRSLRTGARPLPDRWRHNVLALGSAAMLPATFALWLGLEIHGFAVVFHPGVRDGSFVIKH